MIIKTSTIYLEKFQRLSSFDWGYVTILEIVWKQYLSTRTTIWAEREDDNKVFISRSCFKPLIERYQSCLNCFDVHTKSIETWDQSDPTKRFDPLFQTKSLFIVLNSIVLVKMLLRTQSTLFLIVVHSAERGSISMVTLSWLYLSCEAQTVNKDWII